MKILSLNVGRPRAVLWQKRVVNTSIFKSPVEGRRRVTKLNIEGDEQADLRVHGGENKAVYAYDVSSYDHWRTRLDRDDWPAGLFGENLTTEGLPDEAVRIGDTFRAGTAVLQAIQPRFPCFKLNVRFDLPDMVDRFYAEGRHGIYFRVLEAGELGAGDELELIERSPYDVTIGDVTRAFADKGQDRERVARILAIPYLPNGLRKIFTGLSR